MILNKCSFSTRNLLINSFLLISDLYLASNNIQIFSGHSQHLKGSRSCVPCQPFTYQDKVGQRSCIPCHGTVNSVQHICLENRKLICFWVPVCKLILDDHRLYVAVLCHPNLWNQFFLHRLGILTVANSNLYDSCLADGSPQRDPPECG